MQRACTMLLTLFVARWVTRKGRDCRLMWSLPMYKRWLSLPLHTSFSPLTRYYCTNSHFSSTSACQQLPYTTTQSSAQVQHPCYLLYPFVPPRFAANTAASPAMFVGAAIIEFFFPSSSVIDGVRYPHARAPLTPRQRATLAAVHAAFALFLLSILPGICRWVEDSKGFIEVEPYTSMLGPPDAFSSAHDGGLYERIVVPDEAYKHDAEGMLGSYTLIGYTMDTSVSTYHVISSVIQALSYIHDVRAPPATVSVVMRSRADSSLPCFGSICTSQSRSRSRSRLKRCVFGVAQGSCRRSDFSRSSADTHLLLPHIAVCERVVRSRR